MKTLEQEAREYANIPLNRNIDLEERYFNDSVREYDSFIAGANSKYVQAEKIKTQIHYIINEMDDIRWDIREIYVQELEQQLKLL
jgi:hypothetical protein